MAGRAEPTTGPGQAVALILPTAPPKTGAPSANATLNPFAPASLVCAVLIIGWPVAIVLAIMALVQIARSNGAQWGSAMALAALGVCAAVMVAGVLFILLLFAAGGALV